MIFQIGHLYCQIMTAKKISYAVVDIVASSKSELSQMSQVKCLSYSYGYSLTGNIGAKSTHISDIKVYLAMFSTTIDKFLCVMGPHKMKMSHYSSVLDTI